MSTLASRNLLKEITDGNKKFTEAFNQGDAETLASLYGENATVLALDNPGPIVGKEAIQNFWKGVIDLGDERVLTLETLQVYNVTGVAANEVGIWSLLIKKGGTEVLKVDRGVYTVFSDRVGTGRKLLTDHFNVVKSP